MRIVHVTNSDETNIRGVEKHILYLATIQKARRFNIVILIDRPGVFSDACQRCGIQVAVAQGLRPERELLGLPAQNTQQSLIDQFRAFNAELIHCHDLPAAVQAIPAANRIQVPCIFTLHAYDANTIDRFKLARASGAKFTTISVCKAIFEELRKSGLPEADLYYVPNGTQAAPLRRLPKVRQSHRPNLILVGLLTPMKGIDVAILSVAELRRRRGPDCPTLSVYGDGEQGKYLKEMVNVLGLSDIVRFHGMQPGILEHCDSTDILIMPSRFETGPLVVLEAMSRGMAIVATDVGEVVEMLPDRRYGRIVPVDSIVALADAVEALLGDIACGQFDPNLLIERHRSFYTNDKMADRVGAIYKKVLLDNPYVR